MRKSVTLAILYLFLSVVLYSQENSNFSLFLKGKKIKDISFDGDKIWIASEGNGIFEFFPKENRIKNFSTKNHKISNDLIFTIAAGKKYVLAGSIDGLFIYDKRRGRWSKRKFAQGGQLGNYIRKIEYDAVNKIFWIGRFQYLTKFDVRRRRFKDFDLTVNEDIKTNSITTLNLDKENNFLWVGTEGGLFGIDLSGDINSTENRLFFDKRLNYFPGSGEKVSVSAILSERDYIWIGCDEFYSLKNPNYNNGGLYRFDYAVEWLRIDKNKGLSANGISALEKVGNFIFVGVYQFGLNSKKEFGRGIAIINRITNEVFNVNETNLIGEINSMLFDGNFLWVATNNGLVKVKISNRLLNWSLK